MAPGGGAGAGRAAQAAGSGRGRRLARCGRVPGLSLGRFVLQPPVVGVLGCGSGRASWRPASVVELVDTATLKVAACGRAGSSPAGGTASQRPGEAVRDPCAGRRHASAQPRAAPRLLAPGPRGPPGPVRGVLKKAPASEGSQMSRSSTAGLSLTLRTVSTRSSGSSPSMSSTAAKTRRSRLLLHQSPLHVLGFSQIGLSPSQGRRAGTRRTGPWPSCRRGR